MENSFCRLSKKSWSAKLVYNVVLYSCIFIVIAILYMVLHSFNLPKRVLFIGDIICLFILILSLISSILDLTIGFKRYGYKISDSSIEIIHGVYFTNINIIPIRRIQQVSMEQGPILRLFNLYNVSIVTAGSNTSIEYLSDDVSSQIVSNLNNKINYFATISQNKTENYTGIIQGLKSISQNNTENYTGIIQDLKSDDNKNSDCIAPCNNKHDLS